MGEYTCELLLQKAKNKKVMYEKKLIDGMILLKKATNRDGGIPSDGSPFLNNKNVWSFINFFKNYKD